MLSDGGDKRIQRSSPFRILVTGGAGFIGSHTVDLLLEEGYQVRILDSLTRPVHRDGQIPDYVPLDDVEFIHGDIRDEGAWYRALKDVDFVFHLAAYQGYLPDFNRFFHVNTVGTALLYETIIEKRYPVQKVIIASSQAAYGEGKYECTIHGVQYPGLRSLDQLTKGQWEPQCPTCGGQIKPLLSDESMVNPHNQYAMSKYTQEMIGLNLGRRYGIPTVCLRYSITQGARQSFHNAYSGILRIFTMRLLNDKPPIVYEDGQQLRDYVYVGDVARANLLVLRYNRADYQVFNVGGTKATSVSEYAHILAEILGKDIEPLIPGEFRLGDTRHIVSDISKLQTLGWEPVTPLKQIVEEYVAWAQEQPEPEDYYEAAERQMRARGAIRRAHGGL